MSITEDKNLFKQSGLRLTKSREYLLSIFHDNPTTHFTVPELEKILNEKDFENLATLYNNLSTFVKMEIIDEFNFNNQKHYELAAGLHGHFICVNCGDIFNVEVPGLACLKMEINQKYNAKVFANNLEFKGVCKNCIEENHD